MRVLLTKAREYVLSVPESIRTVGVWTGIFFVAFGGIFTITQQDIPYTSELMFVEYSGATDIIGSVVPASCESLGADHTGWGCPTFTASTYTVAYGGSTNFYANLPQPGVWLFCTINGTTVWYYPSWYHYPLNSGPLYSTAVHSMNCQNPGYGWNESWTRTVTVNQVPTLGAATISSATIIPNDSTNYTITVSATDASGAADIVQQHALINYLGDNSGAHRGYLLWGAGNYWPSFKNAQACTGGGYGSIHDSYGPTYLTLVSCSTSPSGNTRTTSFVVRFATTFTSPLTNNDIASYALDSMSQGVGWTNTDLNFAVNVPPTTSSGSISDSEAAANGTTPYTITTVGADLNGGSDITSQMVLINYAGTNAGTYRGYLQFSSDGTFPYQGSSYGDGPMACTGGGQASTAIFGADTYGSSYINLVSCTTSVAGNNRTTTFTVNFESSFTSPTTNNNITVHTRDSVGSATGWQAFDYFSVGTPVNGVCSATLNACTAGTFADVGDSTSQYLWNCAGLFSGSTANCSINKPTLVSSNSSQLFSYGQVTTAISPITITDATSPVVTAANDIRIKIATSSVSMLWDTSDTTASISGSASGKVSTAVTYEGGGSVLVIPVNTNFSAGESITVSGLSFTSFTGVTTATSALRLYLGGPNDTEPDDNGSVGTIAIAGNLAVSNHSAGQVTDAFTQTNAMGEELFAFRLTPAGENITVSSVTFSLQDVRGISSGDITNVTLYRDTNSNKTYDGGDTAVGGSGVPSINGSLGTITFSTPFSVASASDYILVADVSSLTGNDSLRVVLPTPNVVTLGATTEIAVTGSGASASMQHRRANLGGGGSSLVGGAEAPSGDGIQTGGGAGSGGGGFIDSDSGDSLGSEPGFQAPSWTSGSWTGGGNAYASDGSYATAASSVTQTYGNFGFSVPANNQINGIEVKLEASASTAAGNISVRLSWNNGSSDTEALTTATLTATDAVYSLGGPSATWGRSWSASEFNNGNFVIEVVANPSGNTVRIDAIQVRVYHQATGGGGGGGGAVFKESEKHFATVYLAVKDMWVSVFRRFFEWLFW